MCPKGIFLVSESKLLVLVLKYSYSLLWFIVLITLFETQKKYAIPQQYNASIDSDKSNSLDSVHLVDAISLSNNENETIIDEKRQRNLDEHLKKT